MSFGDAEVRAGDGTSAGAGAGAGAVSGRRRSAGKGRSVQDDALVPSIEHHIVELTRVASALRRKPNAEMVSGRDNAACCAPPYYTSARCASVALCRREARGNRRWEMRAWQCWLAFAAAYCPFW